VFNGFTPNGDGVNDNFILILSGEKQAELIIFDQWGGIVFQEDKPNAEEFIWDGKVKGTDKEVPEGTYFFVLKEDGEVVEKNYVELRR
jgi:gliding motility-associated-like protein